MDKVTVNQANLLKILQDNRIKHEQEFNEALVGWKAKIQARAIEVTNKLAEGDFTDLSLHSGFPQPQSYVKDYDKVIRMLELSVDETVEMTDDEIQQYVLDEWRWKQNFTASNSLYK